MEIRLYINTEDDKTVPKQPTLIATVTGEIRDAINVLQPTIRIETSTPLQFNYFYVSALNRYYYFDSISIPYAGIMDVTGRCDVLQSHIDQVKNCPCIVSRSYNVFNTYIEDENRKFYQYTLPEYITIGEFSKPSSVVCVTVG